MRKNQDLTPYLDALERRHLADLTTSEVARALRALSSCYVERRGKLAGGGALDSAGKRAAFAVFYAPIHFLVIREIVCAIPAATEPPLHTILDIGCGTGVAGAAWAMQHDNARVIGIDRSQWSITEANWSYRQLGIRGGAARDDIGRIAFRAGRATGVIAAYTVNELTDDERVRLHAKLIGAYERGASVLIVEPIGRRIATWWDDWKEEFGTRGGRADEWRFSLELPRLQRDLARAAGLDPRELTARSLFLARGQRGNHGAGSAAEVAP